MRTLPPNFHSHEHGGVDAPPRILLKPAYTVLPFIRAPLGYHVVHPYQAIVMALGLSILPPFLAIFYVGFTRVQMPDNVGHEYMIYFAILYLVLSLLRFAWRVLGPRKNIHSAEAGYSWLARLTPLPVWLCEIVLVPAAVGYVGYLIRESFSAELGWWLLICAMSLMLMAVWEAKRRASQRRATVDDIIRAETFEARVSGQEARAKPAAGMNADADKPDVAELGGGKRRRL